MVGIQHFRQETLCSEWFRRFSPSPCCCLDIQRGDPEQKPPTFPSLLAQAHISYLQSRPIFRHGSGLVSTFGVKVLHRHARARCSIIHNSREVVPFTSFTLFTIASATQMSIDGWMKKENVAYTHNGLLFSFTERNLATCSTWMNFKDIMLCEIS